MIFVKTKYTTIKNFTIYGERCSGTNYLETIISQCFNLPVTWQFGHKHFFGHTDTNTLRNAQNTLFLGIIRNPFNWVQSFFKEGYHIHRNHMKSIDIFLTSEWYSVNDDYTENMLDRKYTNNRRYLHIMDMRNGKNHFLFNSMPIIVNNYCLINYDFMLTDQELFLNKIASIFSLHRTSYKPEVKIKEPYYTSANSHKFICSHLNWKTENAIGFYKELYPTEYII